MRYSSADFGTGNAVAMSWGGYRASLSDEKRNALRRDPFNRNEAEIGLARMNGGVEPDDVAGFLINPDGSNLYVDPAQRWLDARTFERTCRTIDA